MTVETSVKNKRLEISVTVQRHVTRGWFINLQLPLACVFAQARHEVIHRTFSMAASTTSPKNRYAN